MRFICIKLLIATRYVSSTFGPFFFFGALNVSTKQELLSMLHNFVDQRRKQEHYVMPLLSYYYYITWHFYVLFNNYTKNVTRMVQVIIFLKN